MGARKSGKHHARILIQDSNHCTTTADFVQCRLDDLYSCSPRSPQIRSPNCPTLRFSAGYTMASRELNKVHTRLNHAFLIRSRGMPIALH